ncbi:EF-hand calcium-binding domain-containing protein 10 [Gadus macrocephalus]|uniref:EF-hand calcium-binding domain-containing protein 10 n=1 Tax=Gadus macrocephalus TaxID=80720 RepID=UPI0028CB4A7C|nr:EF-hand calcium-binding domain-containing protein 10 [Gadus macrocephalus]
MATPRAIEAAKYLERHKIAELMNNLTSSLLFNRPEDPKDFLIDYLGQLKDSKDNHTQGPCLFNESNLDSVFGILDPTNEGYVSYDQYKEALITLGVSKINERPEGGDHDRISRETFKVEARKGLQKSSATYEESCN